jgi:hypothetical protein
VAVRATVKGEWLVLEAEPPKRRQRRWKRQDESRAWLQLHRSLTGNVKFVLGDASRRSAVRLRAEIPLPDAAGSSESDMLDHFRLQVRRGIDSIGAALSLEHDSRPAPAASENGAPEALEAMVTMCKEAGWTVQGAETPRVMLDAEVTGLRQAVASMEGDEVRLLLNLYDDLPEEKALVSKQAIAQLLLRTGSALRLVRPLFSEAHEELGYEVRLIRPLVAADVVHALNALSLAARQSALEAEALADGPLAAAYLASFENGVSQETTTHTREASWATR